MLHKLLNLFNFRLETSVRSRLKPNRERGKNICPNFIGINFSFFFHRQLLQKWGSSFFIFVLLSYTVLKLSLLVMPKIITKDGKLWLCLSSSGISYFSCLRRYSGVIMQYLVDHHQIVALLLLLFISNKQTSDAKWSLVHTHWRFWLCKIEYKFHSLHKFIFVYAKNI